MKRFFSIVTALALLVGGLGFIAQPAMAFNLSDFTWQSSSILAAADMSNRRNPADEKLATEFGQKIDLNNANVRAFRQYRGFYPGLAQKIVKYAPYKTVEDVLEIPGLSETQRERLQANLDNFTVTDPASVFLEGDERINPGDY